MQEGDNAQICLQPITIVTRSLHIHVETANTTEYLHAAIGKVRLTYYIYTYKGTKIILLCCSYILSNIMY